MIKTHCTLNENNIELFYMDILDLVAFPYIAQRYTLIAIALASLSRFVRNNNDITTDVHIDLFGKTTTI